MQTKQLDLWLVASVLHSLDDALTPAANWVLELFRLWRWHQTSNRRKHEYRKHSSITTASLKENIKSLFFLWYPLSIDPRKAPDTDSSEFPTYGKKSIEILLNHYGTENHALTTDNETIVMSPLINEEVHTEWITFHRLLAEKCCFAA